MDRPAGISFVSVLILTVPGLAAAAEALATETCFLRAAGRPTTTAECGQLLVPENPADPDGPQIALAFARVAALAPTPRADPLLLIAGGPGQGTLDFYLALRPAFEPVRADRDLILLDQRGTGRSADGFACPLPPGAALETLPVDQLPALAEQCLTSLDRDPRFYTTSVAVADLEALRRELGVEAWNLYGVSYGTRVAQHYLRRFPERTRAIILDGVVPAELVLGPDISANAQRSLSAIFARCADERLCAERFGSLEERFASLATRLAATPATVELNDPHTGQPHRRAFGGADLTGAVRLLSYNVHTAALLPLLIAEAHDGRYAPLAAQAEMFAEELSDALSFPMHNAVICTEDAPFFPPEGGATAVGYLGSSVPAAMTAICSAWPRGILDADLKLPVRSDRPALLLSGESDPVTPPEYAERIMVGGLGNAAHLIGPGQAHGLAASGCVPRLMRDFLDLPEPAALDSSCLAGLTPVPFFLNFNSPAP